MCFKLQLLIHLQPVLECLVNVIFATLEIQRLVIFLHVYGPESLAEMHFLKFEVIIPTIFYNKVLGIYKLAYLSTPIRYVPKTVLQIFLHTLLHNAGYNKS